MLLHIAPNFVDTILHGTSQDINVIRIGNILRAHREGKHLVHIESDSGKKLLVSRILSASETSTLQTVLTHRPQTGGLKNKLNYYMEIHDTPRQEPWIEKRGRQTIITTPSSWFDDSLMGQSSVLLMENKTDAELIMLLTKAIQIKQNLHHLRTSLEPRGGGGSTISQEQETLKEQKRISLSLADGDLYSPHGSLGSTAIGLLSAVTGAPAFQHATILKARELENLIPTQLYRATTDNAEFQNLSQSIDRLQHIEDHAPGDWRLYIDLKSGLRQCDISHYKSTRPPNDWHYMDNFFKKLQNNSKTTPPSCPTSGNCPERTACPSVALPGLGSNILGHVRNHASRMSSHKLAEHIDSTRDDLLISICETVLSWLCSSQRTVT